MKKVIKGKKATYTVSEINDIGDYRISISGHEKFDDQTWTVGNFNYMDSINRIESGKPMLLRLRNV